MRNLLLFQFLYLTLQNYRAVGHYGIRWITSYFSQVSDLEFKPFEHTL